jgi:hypothetical protein
MSWAHLGERFGIGPAYRYSQYLNHPPLSEAIMIAADSLGAKIGLEYPDAMRLFQILADCFSAWILFKLSRSREITAFFFASPAAIFLSGFHCNADSTMIALLLAAIYARSGALLAASAGIKIAPIPLLPFFLIDLSWRRRFIFVGLFVATLAAIFLPAVITGGTAVLRNVFGYRGTGYEWGICGIGLLLRNRHWAEFYAEYGRFAVVASLTGLFIVFYKRPRPLPAMICTALLSMIFFSPGFGVQYLVWPVPLMLFALPRRLAYALNAGLSLFLFATYTMWSGEFPWWFANAGSPDINRRLIALLAFPLWLLYGVAIVVALRRQSPGQLAAQELAEGGAGD